MHSLVQLQFLSLSAALLLAVSPAPAQDSGAGGGNALQGGVSALDRAAAEQRQTMRVNLGSQAAGFVDNGPTLQSGVHTEKVPPEVFRAWLNDNHSKFALTTQTMANSLVVDVAGRWDHADKTLTKFGINYTHIKTGEITPEILSGARVLIINCAGEVRRDRLQYIRDFVQRGGYLLTTDWTLNNMLEQTFPGYLAWNKGINGHSICAATYISPDPVLARGCVRSAPWKLDAGAHLVRVMRPDIIRVLVASTDLAADDPDRAGVLACLFPFGKGYVLHMVGHFDNNAAIAIGNFLPDPAPGIKISLRQALAANFVVAGLTGEPIPTSGSSQAQSEGGPPGGFRMPPPGGRRDGLRPAGMQQQGLPSQSAPPQSVRQDQPAPEMLQQNHQQPNTVPTAPGAMPPLAPDRMQRQSH
jgi:hypothetical protein